MPASIFLLLYWASLVLLSLGTIMLGHSALILLLAVAKAWLITDGFMELRHGPGRWRWLLFCWGPVLIVLVGMSRLIPE